MDHLIRVFERSWEVTKLLFDILFMLYPSRVAEVVDLEANPSEPSLS